MRLFPILLFLSFFSFGQDFSGKQEKIDSISFYLENARDTLEFSYLKKSIYLSKELKNDSLIRVLKIKYAIAGFLRGDSIERKNSYEELENYYEIKKDSVALAKIYHIKAMSFKKELKLDSSFYFYYKSKTVSELIKDSIQVGRRLLSMGVMQKNQNDLVGAEASLIEGLSYLKPLKESRYTASTYNNLGLTLIRFGRFDEARESFEKALDLHKNNQHLNSKERGTLDYYNNIGFSYMNEENYEKAIIFLNKGLNIKTQFKHTGAYQALLGNLADCLFEAGKRKEAWLKTLELLKLREKSNDLFALSLSHNGIATFYEKEGDNEKALYHAKTAYQLAEKSNNNLTKLSSLVKISNLSKTDSKKYFNKYYSLSDSLNRRERYLKNQFAKIRYETEEKEQENEFLRIERDKQKLRNQIIGLVAIAAFLALGFSFSIFRARRKKLMYEAQLQKASAREEERQQIAKSLHDEVAGDLRMLHQKLSKTELKGEAKSVEKIKDNVRNLSHQLSSVSFDEVSFKDQLINLISDNFSLDFRISTEGIDSVPWEEINNTIKRTLYLCIRESLQNTLKYAEANKFFIQFSGEKKEILLLLKDNGKGFQKGKGKKGIGLKNLKERVEEIQGTFQIDSSEEGTQTNISIPINGR